MKKSTSAAAIQGGHGLGGQDISCMDKDSEKFMKMNKRIKLMHESLAVSEDQGLIEVTTIAAITTETRELVSLPPEVLGIVLQNLGRTDLVQCRGVNSLWRSSTRTILLCRNYEIEFHNVHKSNESSLTNVKLFNECLKNARRLDSLEQIPCTRFQFLHTNLDANVVQRFFILFGPFIKSLSLLDCWSYTKKNGQLRTVSQLLTRHAPNIEDLRVISFDVLSQARRSNRPIFLFPKSPNDNNIKLSHLKNLTADFDSGEVRGNRVVKDLLESADKLENYDLGYLDDSSVLDKLVALNKFHTIKKVKIDLSEPIEFLEKFANLGLNLQCVGFHNALYYDEHDPRLKQVAGVIQKILESSSNSLEIFDALPPLEFLSGLQMPILSKLKEIKMSTIRYWIEQSIFPRGLSLSTVFPNVKKFDLTLASYQHSYQFRVLNLDFWMAFFPHIDLTENTWPNVTSLKLEWPSNSLENFSRLFPNLKHLVVSRVDNFASACQGIFMGMKHLESLQFDDVYGNYDENKYPALDAAWTGFSHETCLRLASSEETLDDVEVENLRENLSILELKNLQTLKLTEVHGYNSLIMSRVSGIFAFQRMPQLTVTVTMYDKNDTHAIQALDVMTPFVHSAKFM